MHMCVCVCVCGLFRDNLHCLRRKFDEVLQDYEILSSSQVIQMASKQNIYSSIIDCRNFWVEHCLIFLQMFVFVWTFTIKLQLSVMGWSSVADVSAIKDGAHKWISGIITIECMFYILKCRS